LRTARRPLDLRLLVAATVRDTQATRAARSGDGPAVGLVQPDTAVVVDGDPVRLAQMLTNLLDNAHKHTPAGTPITVEVTTADGHAQIGVHDAGPGFTPEVAATLFDPFVRSAAAGQPTPAGLGLGLAVVRGIAETHDGTATARSDGPGTGTTFTVRLPLSHRSIADPEPAGPPTRPPLRLLFIDDNEDLAAMYQRLLAERGDTVTVATTATAALTAARDTPYDLILCDLALDADTDGYTIARQLRRSRTHRHTRLIAVSGFSADTDRARSHAAGFDAHLPKPLDPTELDHLLATWTHNWTRPPHRDVV
jgi:CheY-like chemotaxis protein